MDGETGGHLQSHTLGGGAGGVHEIKTRSARRRLGRGQDVDIFGVLTDLLEVAKGFFLNGGQATFDIAGGWLALRQIGGLMRLNHLVHIGLPGGHELIADFRADGAGAANRFGAGDFRGFTETGGHPQGVDLVDEITDRRIGGEARGGIAFPTFDRHPKLGDIARLALQFRGGLNEFLGRPGGALDGAQIAVLFNREAFHRLAGFGDPLNHPVGPFRLNPDDHHGGHIGVAASADQSAEMEVQIGAKLQPAVGVRDGHGAFNVIGDRLARGIRQIVERQNDDMVADADAAILAAISKERFVGAHFSPPFGFYVLNMGMAALRDRRHRLADIVAVFDQGVAIGDIDQSDLVAKGNIVTGGDGDTTAILHR